MNRKNNNPYTKKLNKIKKNHIPFAALTYTKLVAHCCTEVAEACIYTGGGSTYSTI